MVIPHRVEGSPHRSCTDTNLSPAFRPRGGARARSMRVLAAHLGDAVGLAVAPSHVVWFGLKAPGPDPDRRAFRSSWSLYGAPLPILACPPDMSPVFSDRGLRTDVFCDVSRYAPAEVGAVLIPVEQSAGPILLLSGDDDHQWPAAPMAEELVRRMEDYRRGDDVTNVIYPGAGHTSLVQDFMSPPGAGTEPLFDLGGSLQGDQVASTDAWRRTVAFLQGHRFPTD